MNTDLTHDCIFCKRINNLHGKRKWYDFIVLKDFVNFLIVIALGSLVPGYLLVISKRHVPSMSYLDNHEIEELNDILRIYSRKISQIWTKPVLFEHGTDPNNSTGGASISHAHLHLLPVHLDFENMNEYNKINELYHLQSYKDINYQFYSNKNGEFFIRNKSNIPSQYFRRLAAEVLNISNKWDYRIHPFFGNMKETIKKTDAF